MKRILILGLTILSACQNEEVLTPVSVADFARFISETGYVTDAEKYGWSIIQEDVYTFRTQPGAIWRVPNAVDSASQDMPVTQVSFNDAIAYCQWAKVRLPTYEEFWRLSKKDKRLINHNTSSILPVNKVNLIGNVWDITSTENSRGEIRLAGGSFLCNTSTCNGTKPDRVLVVDKETGNVHIGFSVVRED